MDLVAKAYQEGKYLECLTQLSVITTSSLMEEFCVQNNTLVSKFQKSYIEKDSLLRKVILEEFLQLWSKVVTLPHNEKFNFLTICCACNVIYVLLNAECKEVASIKTNQIVSEALEKVSCNYQVFFYQETNSHHGKLNFLVSQLLQCRKLKADEVSLLLYLSVLNCLIQSNHEHVKLVVDLLENLECKLEIDNEVLTFNHIFLLHPHQTPLQFNAETNCYSVVCDLAKNFLSIFYCNLSEWSKVLSVKSAKTSQLSEVDKVVKLFAALHLDSSDQTLPFDCENQYRVTGHLKFVTYLVNAAKFAMKEKPLMALKLLNCAAGEELGRTQVCSVIMTFTATQFKALQQPKFEVEALKIAEESLFKSPSFLCPFHTELDGFLVSQLKLFRLPDISVIRYQLARALLQNQQYQEAMGEYERLPVNSFQQFENPLSSAFKLCFPENSVVLHERVLALILGNECQKALDILDSSLLEDFLLSFLHAEACVKLKQFKKAIQLLNRSIAKLSSTTFPVHGTIEVIRSKFHFRLAQLFDETGNIKDAFHQMKLSVRYGTIDRNMTEFYQKFVQKLGVEKELPFESDVCLDETILQILAASDDLALHYALSVTYLKPF